MKPALGNAATRAQDAPTLLQALPSGRVAGGRRRWRGTGSGVRECMHASGHAWACSGRRRLASARRPACTSRALHARHRVLQLCEFCALVIDPSGALRQRPVARTAGHCRFEWWRGWQIQCQTARREDHPAHGTKARGSTLTLHPPRAGQALWRRRSITAGGRGDYTQKTRCKVAKGLSVSSGPERTEYDDCPMPPPGEEPLARPRAALCSSGPTTGEEREHRACLRIKRAASQLHAPMLPR